MAAGEYEFALPVALDAVQQGQALFKPAPALQLFPLYLLAAQANLGLRRAKQCEDFLALASWLAIKVGRENWSIQSAKDTSPCVVCIVRAFLNVDLIRIPPSPCL